MLNLVLELKKLFLCTPFRKHIDEHYERTCAGHKWCHPTECKKHFLAKVYQVYCLLGKHIKNDQSIQKYGEVVNCKTLFQYTVSICRKFRFCCPWILKSNYTRRSIRSNRYVPNVTQVCQMRYIEEIPYFLEGNFLEIKCM